MAKALSRAQANKQLLTGLNKIFDDDVYEIFDDVYENYSERKVYEVIRRGDTFDVHERTLGMADDVVLASKLSETEVSAVLNLLPNGHLIEHKGE